MFYQDYKTILSQKNGMNIFRGCTHGCVYCDSRSICYQMNHDFENIEVKRNAPQILRLLQLDTYFDYVADAAAVPRAKPFPDVFLACSDALGVPPEECVGIEDAQAGIEAIHAAGMRSVGIGLPSQPPAPDIPLASTAELQLETLLQRLEEL